MPITATTSSVSMTPSQPARPQQPKPARVISQAPFTPAAQKQANAINTGRDPHRGRNLDIKA